ncbi:uncharacterized protein LOC117172342 isoform X1 [Belonocnema kinseyi]|uniref:uncharacterized protein LOC117172342 isoform X1 n=1 Tax=Belonocnema kinseyi TaxID=2817044 RepID=UPI00143CCA1E|nr:uncharacterized protein LOC117172342 isoform X1 [Belonocnema kinseyi]XP_033216044.1 uncharacterized protein LOC117172342 isoform X1 [Belonocnema kinseyi]
MYDYQDEVKETTLTGSTDEIDLDRSLEKTTTSNFQITEDYDYDKLKAEYYYQIQEFQRRNETFNYTDQGESEETAKAALKKIVDFKMPRNCTKEELSQIGVKAFECLIFDYQHAKNKTDVKKVLDRTWMVIKIWVLIYFCIAIPCWCQKGWCCCCFCCETCFPMEIIVAEKKYFSENPPGTLVKGIKDSTIVKKERVNYKPTLSEYDAYEKFESAIRNI